MSAEVDVAIVGAGVVGCAVARERARAGSEVFVIEKNTGVTRGENRSSRNSGVIHAGLNCDRSPRPPRPIYVQAGIFLKKSINNLLLIQKRIIFSAIN